MFSCEKLAYKSRVYGMNNMTSLRLTLIRTSIVLNAFLIAYLFLSWYVILPVQRIRSKNIIDYEIPLPLQANTTPIQFQQNFQLSEEIKRPRFIESVVPVSFEAKSEQKILEKPSEPTKSETVRDELLNSQSKETILNIQSKETEIQIEPEYQEPPRDIQERADVTEAPSPVAPLVEEIPDPPLDSLERKMYPTLRDCVTQPIRTRYLQRGDYWILENYIPAAMSFRCDESITYTTHGDYTFLDNLDPLTSKWQGPVSIAVYAPGTDFENSIDTIFYLRNCMAEGVKKYVTFHLYFHMNHIPKKVPSTESLLQRKLSCDKDPPKWVNVTTYRQQKKLLYPINVARNLARSNAVTFFNFPSDVELYPSLNVIPEFFKMLKIKDASPTMKPRVYVFPIFEVEEGEAVPENKAELQSLLKKNKAVAFHKYVCPMCHGQPKSKEWQAAPMTSELSVFNIGKRREPYKKWEPIYIGTQSEPIYDERLSWEGKSDKMTQMYILCVRDYELHILNNAFLVHRPGIKKYHKNKIRDNIAARQTYLIRKKIYPEYRSIFGTRKSCII